MIASPNAQIHTATSYSGFVTEAAALIASAGQDRAFTVSYIDITGFKKFNDHYGFSAGDRLLSDLSAQLKTMRRTVLCSRVFSDHFLRLAQYDPAADTMAQLVENMEQTLCALEDRIARQYPDCSISFSCGYCRIEGGQTGLIQAMDDANLARKEAKALGRTRAVWFDLSLREKLAERERLEVEIRSGLRNEQFTFFLQPKVDLHTGAIVGAEALARWNRPDGKQVLPDQFIPLMEESDLILSLDQLIFRQVCDYLRTRLTQEKPVVPISVNMSRRHLHHADFADILNRLARDRNIPPYLLEIELTETVLLNDPAEAKDAVAKLRAYGYRVSIDDFGSGYTSMNLWRDLDFDVVKLDKSYILDRPDRGEALRNDIVVTSISYISRQFNTPLLCEGPETAEQCAHMEALGCDIAQGYFFSPPVEPARFDLLLEAGSFDLPYQSGWDRLPQYSHQEITALQGGREVLDLAGCAMLVIGEPGSEEKCRDAVEKLEEIGVDAAWETDYQAAVSLAAQKRAAGRPFSMAFLPYKMLRFDRTLTGEQLKRDLGGDTLWLLGLKPDEQELFEEIKQKGFKYTISLPLFRMSLYRKITGMLGQGESISGGLAGELKGMRLLVVEDNAVNLEIAVEMLSGLMGAAVDTARNGEEGCTRFLDAPEDTYDVILMDLQMPVLGGLDAARRIRESIHPQAASIPIIALTANAFEEDRREALEAGMNGFVPKPIDFAVLAKEIGRVRREGRCLRLLLAEDNELNREIAAELIRADGQQVDAVENGHQALEAYLNAPDGTYDAILLDLRMPVMDGFEAAAAIRSSQRKSAGSIPVFAFTSSSEDEVRSEAARAGFGAVLTKPINMEQLRGLLG